MGWGMVQWQGKRVRVLGLGLVPETGIRVHVAYRTIDDMGRISVSVDRGAPFCNMMVVTSKGQKTSSMLNRALS